MKKNLKIFIPKEEFEKEMDLAIENFSFPGFRKGDVPGVLFKVLQDQNNHFNSIVQRYVLKSIFDYVKTVNAKFESYKIQKIVDLKKGWEIEVEIFLETKKLENNSNQNNED